MTTTASSTPCSSGAATPLETPRRRLLLRQAGALAAGAVLLPPTAQAAGVEVPQLRLERDDEALYLFATLDLELPQVVDDALLKGIPLFFVAEADLLRERWYWSDARLAHAERHFRLAYQPLVRRWRLNVSPTPIGNAGLGVALSQNFDDRADALAALCRITRWRIADAAALPEDGRAVAEFRFRLDRSQLPRPLQISVAGRGDWALSVERRLRYEPEAAR